MTSVPVGTDAALPESPLPQYGPMLEHPRPQLTRPGWEDLGGTWAFAFDDAAVGPVRWHSATTSSTGDPGAVPLESPASGINDTGFHPVVWYRRDVHARPQRPRDRRAAALRRRRLQRPRLGQRLAGRPTTRAATRRSPRTSPTPSMTPASQVVVVRAEDDPPTCASPAASRTGSASRTPSGTTARRDLAAGLAEDVPETVALLRWTPDVDQRSLDLTVRLRTDAAAGRGCAAACRCGTRHGSGRRHVAVRPVETQRRITLRERHEHRDYRPAVVAGAPEPDRGDDHAVEDDG